MELLATTTVAGAVTGQVGRTVDVPRDVVGIVVEAAFAYGSGGTTAKAWVQTRIRNGTWRDIMCFAFTTAAATKFQAVRNDVALAANQAASDAALADNTILDGLIGDELRVKYTTTGTYAGATNLTLRASLRHAG